jgi:hypothetical protein
MDKIELLFITLTAIISFAFLSIDIYHSVPLNAMMTVLTVMFSAIVSLVVTSGISCFVK